MVTEFGTCQRLSIDPRRVVAFWEIELSGKGPGTRLEISTGENGEGGLFARPRFEYIWVDEPYESVKTKLFNAGVLERVEE